MSKAAAVTLEDKYRLDAGRALISGRQALVRLPLLQRESDRRRGLNTAGLISGYRGSPLGSYDLELWKAADILRANAITFQPGLNEDLALTALTGSQQINFLPGPKVDGVFCIWYGKGPGIDRSGDAIRHGNLQGVSPHGGVLLVFGDDHPGKSSTTAHQSDLTLASWGVPILYPSSVAEILTMGLAGFALSRYSGLLVGLKLVNETADGTAVIESTEPHDFVTPQVPLPEGGIHIRPEVLAVQQQDMRLVRYKLPLAQTFAAANRLDRIVYGDESPRFLIATAGKAFPEVMAALQLLGIDARIARQLRIGVYKIALLHPLDPVALQTCARGAAEIFFVEEKRAHAEVQAKALLYHLEPRPRVTGKETPEGRPLLPADLPLDATIVAEALAERLRATLSDSDFTVCGLAAAVERLKAQRARAAVSSPAVLRRPAFCPGCPHNTSTRVPEGSFGATGIGCHGMVLAQPERNPLPMGHMGAEGAQWIGLAPFTATEHIFQNLGDGTYSHSGSLAIRAAVLAGVNITYKILFNDAVAMTGGQPVEGRLTVSRIVAQVQAEGVKRVVVVSEDPGRFARAEPLPAGTELRHRDELAAIQQALRSERGVTVLIYDQTCAAEKRRRRRLNLYPDPDRRLFIHAAVCEGCGDCSMQSNCLAIQPLETELGRKRRIDQSACNKDVTCEKGFCPAFVTVEGARLRRQPQSSVEEAAALPEPTIAPLGEGFDMVLAGIGGTGVVTVSAIVGMAARIDGLGAHLYDMTGLSQKGGQVFSHVRLRPQVDAVVPARVGPQQAHLLLACDLVAAVQKEALETLAPGKTLVVANTDTTAIAEFQRHRDLTIHNDDLVALIRRACDAEPALLPASTLSQSVVGDSISANLVMLGYAWQRGVIPLSRTAIETAIELNGKAVRANLQAFNAGRAAALDAPRVVEESITADEFIRRRAADLEQYWDSAYSKRYTTLLSDVQGVAHSIEGADRFVWAVARSAFKLMAYKDEYEVARLYAHDSFREALKREFASFRRLEVHLSPPLFARHDRRTGRPRKITFGPWIFLVFRLLAGMRRLREGPFDPFRHTEERRIDRELRDTYLRTIRKLLETLSPSTLPAATELAAAPLQVRGFGPVKLPAARALLEKLRAFN